MKKIIDNQRDFFNTNATKDTNFRVRQLRKLKRVLKENEGALNKAIYADYKKSTFETYLTELRGIYHDIDIACKNIKKWSKIKRVKTSLINFPAKSYVIPEPLGVSLVIGAWNYPYQLTFTPVVAAIAAGNTVILKPSEIPTNTSSIMAEIINDNFPPEFMKVIEGGVPETTELLKQKFDKIFFTGSTAVGKIVYQAAANNLTPVTLELGGKSPAIFTEKCNIKMGVKRMIWAKFLNAGQTCVAPDYVLVHKSKKEEFLKAAVKEIEKAHYSFDNDNYVQIINERNTQRVVNLIEKEKVYYGGRYDIKERYIEPTLMTNIKFEDKIMQEEIFGPVLPIIEYDDLDKIISTIKSQPKPLACYVFTDDKQLKRKILHEFSFGGGGVNEALMHVPESNMPFGGVGGSGIGAYHGEDGFKTFSHFKSIVDKPTWFESNFKYFPYTENKFKLITRI